MLAPLLSVRVPAMGDTLNHLARMHILAEIGRSPDLQRFYAVDWTPIPYLAMDAIVPLLARIMPIYLAGKLFVAACVLSPVAGCTALHFAVHRRASLVPCAAFLFGTNMLLSLGFLNFLFSAGLALGLLAGWVATAGWPRWPRAGLFAGPVLLLYFGHVFACAAYCLSVAGYEAGRAWQAGLRPRRTVLADITAAFAQAIPALIMAARLDVGAGYVGGLHTVYGDMGGKLIALVSPVMFLRDAVHLGVLLAAVALLGLAARRLALAPLSASAALLCGLVAMAVPSVLDSTWGTDLRLPLIVLLLLVAATSVRPGHLRPAWRGAALAVLFALVLAKSTDAWVALHFVDDRVAETRRVLAALPRGARLLLVDTARRGTGREAIPQSTWWHMPLVAVIDRDAFVPTLFSGLSTVHVRPAYRLSSTPNGPPISLAQLAEGLARSDGRTETGDGTGGRSYHFGWPEKFDFVFVQHYGQQAGPLPGNLRPVQHGEGIDLYRIVLPGSVHAGSSFGR